MADKKQILKLAVDEVALRDAGHTIGEKGGLCAPTNKNKKYYPCIYLNADDVPALVGHDTGEELTIVARAYIKGHSMNNYGDDKKRENFDLELRSIGIIGTPKKD